MRKIFGLFFIILFVIINVSCNPDWGNLGGYRIEYDSEIEYYIYLDQGEVIYFTDDTISKRKKGTLIKFHKNDKTDFRYVGREGIIVPPFIDKKNIAYNDDFILVDQKPLDEIFKIVDNHYTINPTYEELLDSEIHKYWIICKKSNDIYGSLSREDFIKIRTMLNIPEKLKIKLTD